MKTTVPSSTGTTKMGAASRTIFPSIVDVERRMQQLWKQMSQFGLDSLFDRPGSIRNASTDWAANVYWPQAELSENDKEYCLRMDLPGMQRDQIELDLQGLTLRVSGDRLIDNSKKDDRLFFRETEYGHFERLFEFPAPVEQDNLAASYKDGVLTVTAIKKEPAKHRHIDIH